MIDKNNGIDFSVNELRRWKADHENWILASLNKSRPREFPRPPKTIKKSFVTYIIFNELENMPQMHFELHTEASKKCAAMVNFSCPYIRINDTGVLVTDRPITFDEKVKFGINAIVFKIVFDLHHAQRRKLTLTINADNLKTTSEAAAATPAPIELLMGTTIINALKTHPFIRYIERFISPQMSTPFPLGTTIRTTSDKISEENALNRVILNVPGKVEITFTINSGAVAFWPKLPNDILVSDSYRPYCRAYLFDTQIDAVIIRENNHDDIINDYTEWTNEIINRIIEYNLF